MAILGSFEIVVLGVIGCSAIACGTFLRWGWRQQRQATARQAGATPLSPTPPLLRFSHLALPSTKVDAGAEIRDVLTMVDAEAACRGVHLEMAVAPDLWLRTNPVSLRALLVELVRHAIRQTPNGQVLVSAARLGGCVQVAVTDDGVAEPEAVQQAALREAAQVAALQGGTLEIESVPGQGSVVTVRLPAPPEPGVSGGAAAEGAAQGAAQAAAQGTGQGVAGADIILEW